MEGGLEITGESLGEKTFPRPNECLHVGGGVMEGGLEVMGESLGERSFPGQDNSSMYVK